MTAIARATPSAAPIGGQRRLVQGWYKAADLGGGFAALPKAGVVTSDPLLVSGFNGAMAWINSTQGGSISYTVSLETPARPSDPVFSVSGAFVAGVQIHTFGKQGVNGPDSPPWPYITLSWINRIPAPAGTLSGFMLYVRGKV